MGKFHRLLRALADAGDADVARTTRRSNGSRLVPTPQRLQSKAFVAVDFETANRVSRASACQIALVKVNRGRVVDRFDSLIKPPAGVNKFEFTYLHGIGPGHVARAPQWPQLVDTVAKFVAGLPVYAHNASFDAGVWRALDEYFDTSSLPEEFYCSYRTAKRIVPGLENYKLPTVARECAPGFKLDHHRAGSDAEACALIVAELQRRSR
ncbi:DNA polymerase III subunit epsilon [Corynebacterium atypicum]|uniref:DNA polymerase III subunit epsilon n=1 Tax=Corynebacterium atypicum TaxID=191610 RepID=A0ABN4DD92_9CORY|nr:3'-5' exonuclease [Corynebacterium atypicum]AIG64388.1 DNA polymerase III subunit epsilon [Corynebacterium atypicum]